MASRLSRLFLLPAAIVSTLLGVTASTYSVQSFASSATEGATSNARALKAIKTPGPVVLDPVFVEQFRNLIPSKKDKAWDLQIPSRSAVGPALEELKLLVAEALVAKGYALSAQVVYLDVALRSMGTSQGTWALYEMNRLAAQHEIDEDLMESFAFDFDGAIDNTNDRAEERAMVAYFRARALVRRGYEDWAIQELGKVSTDSQWHADRLFERAAEVLADGRADEAEAIYEELSKRENVRKPTKEFAVLNRARLVFERGNYDEVLETVKSADLPLRERARALLEMAWARYYLKEYGKALGVLKVIDSAFFQMLRSPESDLLRMVIERDLCRYDLIKESAAAFRSRYQASFKQIESRLNLEADEKIKQLALQGRNLQKRATLIHRFRTELKDMEDEDLRAAPGLREALIKGLKMGAFKTEASIARSLPREVERVASHLIELRDQVSFLEYEASIRPLTTLPVDDADYKPIAASKTSFDRLYWPVIDESWWDELDNYEVLIRARCSEPIPQNVLRPPAPKKAAPPPIEEEEEEEEEDE